MNTISSLLKSLIPAALIAAALPLRADVVETADGARLTGKIARIEDGIVHLETAYAGTIQIKQENVTGISTDGDMHVAFKDGSTLVGRTTHAGGTLTVGTVSGANTGIASVRAAWLPDGQDPEMRKLGEKADALKRRWIYEAAVDLTGRSGNSDSFGSAIALGATLKGPDDALAFNLRYNYAEQEDTTTADDVRGGVDYSSHFAERWSWYVRSEIGRDEIAAIDMFSHTAGGLGTDLIKKEKQLLTFRAGLAYIYETYDASEDLSSAALDIGINHEYSFSFGLLRNAITYMPSLDDFGNYRVNHESTLELPIGTGEFWKLRLGVSNYYVSDPQPGKEDLDTTWFTRLVLTWR